MADPLLEEIRHGINGDWVDRWLCAVPEVGVGFEVLEMEWLDEEPPVRIIRKVRICG